MKCHTLYFSKEAVEGNAPPVFCTKRCFTAMKCSLCPKGLKICLSFTSVEPVKATLSTSMWAEIAAPAVGP